MKKIVKNRYLDALYKLMIFASIVHMGIVILFSLATLDFSNFNFYDILGINLLFPLGNNELIAIIVKTLLTMIGIVIYLLFFKDSKKD